MRSLAFVLLAACSSTPHATPDASSSITPDAPIDSASAPFTVAISGNPVFAAYRDAQYSPSPWKMISTNPVARGDQYPISITYDYQVVIGCQDDSGQRVVQLLEATVGDGNQILSCPSPSESITTKAITGHMVQPGDVWFGTEARSDTGPWDFTLDVDLGTYDLVAASNSHSIVVRRNLDTNQIGSLAPIDVAAEGSPMTPIDVGVSGMTTGENLVSGLFFSAGLIPSASTTIYAPPASLLEPGDQEELFAIAYTPTTFRLVEDSFPITGNQPSLVLPAAPLDLSISDGRVWFLGLPAVDTFDLLLQQPNNGSVLTETVHATKRWIDDRDATSVSLGFDAPPPPSDASWSVDPSRPYDATLELYHRNGTIDEVTIVTNGASVQSWCPVILPALAASGTAMRSKHPHLPFSLLAAAHRVTR